MQRKTKIIVIVVVLLLGLWVFLRGSEDIEENIIVFSPQPTQTIKSPLVIEGKARGFWFFEADFPVKLLDSQGRELAKSYVATTENWMTDEFVSFKGTL